jgi:gliding motility-associated-like protein
MNQITLTYQKPKKSAIRILKLAIFILLTVLGIVTPENLIAQQLGLEWAITATDSVVSNSYYNHEGSNKIIPDHLGNVYVVGSFSDTVDFESGPGITKLMSNGSTDVFIKKLDGQGNLLWVKQVGGKGTDVGVSIAKDSNGDIYITGQFADTVDFNPGFGVYSLASTNKVSSGSSTFYSTIFILKLNANGSFIWAKSLDVALGSRYSYNNLVGDITLDSLNNVYLTGLFHGTVDFNPGTTVHNLSATHREIFVLKLNSNGLFVWAKEFNRGSGSRYSYMGGRAVTIDPGGNVLITGAFDGTVDFNPGSGIFNLTSWGSGDIFIAKLSSSGNFVWAVRVGQSSYDYGSDIITDSLGSAYITGSFQDYTDFDPGSGTYYRGIYTWWGGFILKLDSNAVFTWVETFNGQAESIDRDKYGNFIIAGHFEGVVDFDETSKVKILNSGSTPIQFIKKMDGNQNVFWAKAIPVVNYGFYHGWFSTPSACIDSLESIFMCGRFDRASGFNPNSNAKPHVPFSTLDMYEMKLCQCSNSFTEISTDSLICQSGSIPFNLINAGQYDSVLWDFGDTNSVFNFSWADSAGHVFNSSGVFNIKATVFCKCITDTIRLTIMVKPLPVVNLGNDTILCEGDSIQIQQFDTNNQYLWSTGDTTLNIQIFADDTFSVQVTNICGVTYDTIVIDSVIPALAQLPNDTIMCIGDTINLDASIKNGSYLWSTGFTDSVLSVTNSGIYSVTSTNVCGADIDSIEVYYINAPKVGLGSDTLLCMGDTLVLTVYDTLGTSLWSSGSIMFTDTIFTTNIVYVTVSNQCGQLQDTMEIHFLDEPIASLGSDTIVCVGDSLNLKVVSIYCSYQWSNTSILDSIWVDTTGFYSLIKSNICGVDTDTVYIQSEHFPTLNLGNDTLICEGSIIQLSAYYSNSIYQWNNGSADSIISVTTEGKYNVEVTNSCGISRDTLTVEIDSVLLVNLGPDTILCLGDSLRLESNEKGSSYLWSTGDTTDGLLILSADTYSLTVSNVCGSFTDERAVYFDNSPVTNLGPDSIYCINTLLNLDAFWSRANYLWNTTDTSSAISPNKDGIYSVKVTNLCGFDGDTIELKYDIPISFNLGNDTIICIGDSFSLTAEATNAKWLWNDLSTDKSFMVRSNGVYHVVATNTCGSFTDSIQVNSESYPIINPKINDTSFCEGAILNLKLNLNNAKFINWDNGSNALNREISKEGKYKYSMFNDCGSTVDSFFVGVDFPLDSNLGYDTVICYGEEVTKSVYHYNHTYLWNDGSTDSIRTFNSQGHYGVTIWTDKNCESYDEFEIRNCESPLYIPSAFTPGNGDDINNRFYVRSDNVYKFRVVIYNRWGSEVYQSINIDQGWDGKVNGKISPPGVYVYKVWYNIGLGPNSITEVGEVILLR